MMKVKLKNGMVCKVKSKTTDSLEKGCYKYHLIDANGDTVWFNGWLLYHPESYIECVLN
jgi:hypothetical protein